MLCYSASAVQIENGAIVIMTKDIKFKVSLDEFVYLTLKLNNEKPKGYIFNADKSKILNQSLVSDLLFLKKLGGHDEEIKTKLSDYIRGLVANISPEYYTTIRSCVRSFRSRSAKKLDNQASSMTIDKGLQGDIKSYIAIFKKEGVELTQSELVKIALESLTRERSGLGKVVPKLPFDYSKMLIK